MPRCADAACRVWRPVGGLRLNGNWYCSRACVERAALNGLGEPLAAAQGRASLPPPRLGVLLRHAGVITEQQLREALAAQEQSKCRLGQQLERMGLAGPEAVLRALAAQAGVSYLWNFDTARVRQAPGGLTRSMVRALGLVPFETDATGTRLHVICAAPLPRTAIRAMTRLTGWQLEVFLVTDRVFAAALEAYSPANGTTAAHDGGRLRSLDAAAARVAERAALERAVTMRHVAYDDYVWVRVEGTRQVSDLLVTRERAKERTCQAAFTAR